MKTLQCSRLTGNKSRDTLPAEKWHRRRHFSQTLGTGTWMHTDAHGSFIFTSDFHVADIACGSRVATPQRSCPALAVHSVRLLLSAQNEDHRCSCVSGTGYQSPRAARANQAIWRNKDVQACLRAAMPSVLPHRCPMPTICRCVALQDQPVMEC